MGGCCYSPTKRDFLWWYWLLLASIVGIPMLLAVLYVVWWPAADEDAKRERGKTAAWIFWIGTFLVAITAFYTVDAILRPLYIDEHGRFDWGNAAHNQWRGWWALAVQFFFATVMANLTNDWTRKENRWYLRVLFTLLGIGMFLSFLTVDHEVSFRRPAINVMQFMVCMLPAHYWGKFKDVPDARHAWWALLAFLVASPLMFLVGYFGEDVAQLVSPLAFGGE
jgi:hypothetical protein